jgi:predicted Zn-dependent protease
MTFSSLFLPFRRTVTALSLAGLLSCTFAPAWSQQAAPKKELSEKVSEDLAKIRAATDAKNYAEAVVIIDRLLKGAAPESYDLAVLSQVKAQILLTQADYSKAIDPLETAVLVSERNGYFEPKVNQELRYFLAQLFYQEAVTSKSRDALVRNYSKAAKYLEQWSKANTKPNPDAQLFFASLLYNQAQIDPNNVDMALIRRSQEEVEKGLEMSVRPKDTFYVLLLATLQQQNQTARSAEILELLVKIAPKNKTYWAQLASTYLNLQQDLRAALTIERAQVHEAMNTPKDNFNLVGIYFNMQQYDQAIALLEKGLRDGSIDSEQRNWELLAASLQQVRREARAIDVLKEATKQFPDSGSLYLTIAQIYYSLDKLEDSYSFAAQAVTHKLDKPWQAYTFLAYICFELKKFSEALEAINAALKSPEAGKDSERLKKAIEDAIKEREALANSPAA